MAPTTEPTPSFASAGPISPPSSGAKPAPESAASVPAAPEGAAKPAAPGRLTVLAAREAPATAPSTGRVAAPPRGSSLRPAVGPSLQALGPDKPAVAATAEPAPHEARRIAQPPSPLPEGGTPSPAVALARPSPPDAPVSSAAPQAGSLAAGEPPPPRSPALQAAAPSPASGRAPPSVPAPLPASPPSAAPMAEKRLALLPTIGAASIREALAPWLADRPCRDVRVESDDRLQVQLQGRIEDAAARAALRQHAIAAGATSVDESGLAVVSEPFCGLLDQLAHYPYAGPAPALELGHRDGVYEANEEPGAVVTAPEGVGKVYIYVISVDTQGRVEFLLPSRIDWGTQVTAGEERRLGSLNPKDHPSFPTWAVQPPYGEQMLVALMSSRPLDALSRGTSKTISMLVETLDHALRYRPKGDGIAVAWRLLDVRARRGQPSMSDQ
ncbi:MAG: DUF4384 domain-containing protein [Alphaproteobacteria bacterium]|nr:DUF4384 domain-containing protein [Alphaproteobacteria bacterium]